MWWETTALEDVLITPIDKTPLLDTDPKRVHPSVDELQYNLHRVMITLMMTYDEDDNDETYEHMLY